MLLEKAYVSHIKNMLQVPNNHCYTKTVLLLICLLGVISCETQRPSLQVYPDTIDTPMPHQREVEEFLGIRFTKCRDIHFYESKTLSLGDYTTLISFEVPRDSLILLLDQSPKLPSYSEFAKNAGHITFLGQVVKDIDWWKFIELENPLAAIKSWCTQREEGKCFLYAYALVAFDKAESDWVRIYICSQAERWPLLLK